MRYAIDTNALYTTRAGVARYVRGLLGGLRRLPETRGAELLEYAWPVENFAFRQPARAWRTFYREFVWAGLLARRRLSRTGAKLLHTTATPLFVPPPGVAHVITVHDIGFLRFPERFRGWHRRMAIRGLERTRAADRVICISQHTANELVHLAQFPPDRLRVVHNGCDFHGAELPERPPETPPPGEFFLFVGSLEPGKNLALLREMYELASRRQVALPGLVIVGARFAGLVGEGAPPANWQYLGHQPDATLLWLYRRAQALLFPSKYEGFGLPLAEAMNQGCPVICSPISSLPEVTGDAALLPEQSAEAYLSAVQRLLSEPGLRDDLIARGRVQGKRFHWDRCAQETFAVYQEALAEQGGTELEP